MSKFNSRKALARIKELDLELENVIKEKRDSTLFDYVKWIGRFGFDEMPLCEADILVLCVVSYFEFSTVMEGLTEIRLKDTLAYSLLDKVKLMITGGDMGNTNIYRSACESKRFGNLLIKNYVNDYSEDPPIQFSALTFYSDTGFNVICYRGTDSTIAGWKENFMISFMRTEAQERAENYARKLIDGQSDWYIAGHSKGGNLALCAALNLPQWQFAFVKHVFLLDGPGLCPEVMDEKEIKRIDPVTTRVIPEYDVIGKLFEPKITDTKIIKSFRRGINQHSLASWLVEHGNLSTVKSNSPGSNILNEIVDSWIKSVDLEGRKKFVNELFDSMSVDGVTDLSVVHPDYYGNVVIKLTKKSKDTKRILGEIPRKIFLDGVFDDFEQKKSIFTKKQFEFLFAGGLALFGLIMILASRLLYEITSIFIIAVIISLQAFILIRRIIIEKHVGDTARLRIILLIGLAGILAVLLLKPTALSVFGSVIFGLLFAVYSYTLFERISLAKTRFLKVFAMVDFFLSIGFAVSFFIMPEKYVFILGIIAGAHLIVEALFRTIYLIVYYIKDKAHGKVYDNL